VQSGVFRRRYSTVIVIVGKVLVPLFYITPFVPVLFFYITLFV
jgi:hypothetical protein